MQTFSRQINIKLLKLSLTQKDFERGDTDIDYTRNPTNIWGQITNVLGCRKTCQNINKNQ